MVIVLLAQGFEEIEALTPVDMLRRAGVTVKTVGIGNKTITGSHDIPVVCDLLPEEVDLSEVTAVIFPGGMPGALNLDASPFTNKVIDEMMKNGGRIAAICAAPLILGRRGLLNGKKATCYPGFEKELMGADVIDEGVVTDGNITTAKGMGVSLDFAKELVSLLVSPEKATELSEGIMEKTKEEYGEVCAEWFDDEEEDLIKTYLKDKLFLSAVELAISNGKIATSLIQRKLSIGYGKAAKFMDVMEDLGIIEKAVGPKPRDTLVTLEQWENIFAKYNKKR